MPDRAPVQTVHNLTALARAMDCQACGTGDVSSGDCAGGVGAPPSAHAGHNYKHIHHSIGRAGARNSRNSCCRGDDRHIDHGHNLDPDNGLDCPHSAGLDTRYAGRHDDPAPLRVARRRRSARQPGSVLAFSFRSPRLAPPRRKLRHLIAEARLNGSRTSIKPILLDRRNLLLRSPCDVRLETSVPEEVLVRNGKDRAVGAGHPCRAHGETTAVIQGIQKESGPTVGRI